MKKAILVALIVLVATVTLAHADTSKISPELKGYNSTQKVQVIVQYAPGTQVSCTGLIPIVGCLLNDIVKLGGTILSQLPLVNGVIVGTVNVPLRDPVVGCTNGRVIVPV